MGVDAMIEGLELVRAGVKLKHPQNLADGSYESWFKKDLAEIDWSKPVADVYNVIRAANPPRRLEHHQGPEGRHLRQRQGCRQQASRARSQPSTANGVTIAAGGGADPSQARARTDGKKIPAGDFDQGRRPEGRRCVRQARTESRRRDGPAILRRWGRPKALARMPGERI
jgi:methionyl-tRNA formyltransferase